MPDESMNTYAPDTPTHEATSSNEPPVYGVAELSGTLKRVVEDAFGYVRVRGEVSGFKRAASGPTTTKSMVFSLAKRSRPSTSSAAIGTH